MVINKVAKTPYVSVVRRVSGPCDPTTTRLSDSVLLSDMLNCDSVHRHGYSNSVREGDWDIMLREGAYLCELLEAVQAKHGAFSITYARISPSLSEKIVRWRDPRAPSLHRFDMGAAADVIFHDHVLQRGNLGAPILLASDIDTHHNFNRMITYAGSAGICIGTNLAESNGRARRALLENRMTPFRQPRHIKWGRHLRSLTPEQIMAELDNLDWRGPQPWPQYHLKGVRNYQHFRVSRYTTALDYLYSNDVLKGRMNRLPATGIERRHIEARMKEAGRVIDALTNVFSKRMSIVDGYHMGGWPRGFEMTIVPPASVDVGECMDVLNEMDEVGLIDRLDDRKIMVQGL